MTTRQVVSKLPRTQVDAFDTNATRGEKNLHFTIMFADGSRSHVLIGDERRMLNMFWDISQSQDVMVAEGENSSGYYTVTPEAMSCNCGNGLRCEFVEVTKYE